MDLHVQWEWVREPWSWNNKRRQTKMKNENLIWLIVGISVLLFFFGGFSMMGFGGWGSNWMGGMMYGYNYGGMWLFGWLFMILVSIAVVLLILWLVKQLQKK